MKEKEPVVLEICRGEHRLKNTKIHNIAFFVDLCLSLWRSALVLQANLRYILMRNYTTDHHVRRCSFVDNVAKIRAAQREGRFSACTLDLRSFIKFVADQLHLHDLALILGPRASVVVMWRIVALIEKHFKHYGSILINLTFHASLEQYTTQYFKQQYSQHSIQCCFASPRLQIMQQYKKEVLLQQCRKVDKQYCMQSRMEFCTQHCMQTILDICVRLRGENYKQQLLQLFCVSYSLVVSPLEYCYFPCVEFHKYPRNIYCIMIPCSSCCMGILISECSTALLPNRHYELPSNCLQTNMTYISVNMIKIDKQTPKQQYLEFLRTRSQPSVGDDYYLRMTREYAEKMGCRYEVLW